ncbi:FAD-dependent monooxygenase [Bradyrhizobium cenepequi]|uniref:FAD-dependent monooxygenase n=1 Tax=Bradyrhizobium cenepequi TaxID=2821403 RepID=UPI001CE34D63|nr:FAD-dependent monooxygenase [Bradyrhizobium cenepequi]
MISGAGVAGPTLAYWLKAAGFQPTLVERAPALRSGGYAIDFWGLGYDIAERMGLIGQINTAGYHVRQLRIVDDAGGQRAGFTLHDNRTLFLFVFSAPGACLPAILDQQKAMLRDVYGRDGWECPHILDELDRIGELYFDRVSQVKMQNWSRGRVALIGDAAFCVSLLAGQGSALAMISAYVLAAELAAAHGQYELAFGRYERLLRGYIAARQRAAQRFAGAFAPKTRFGLSFRDLVVKAFAIPGLARLAIGADIADSVQLPEYSWPSLNQWAIA